MTNDIKLPRTIDGGKWPTGHVQGITVDTAHKYIYYSFTTVLVKTDLEGNLIGTVDGLLGHLGCIDFNDDDGRVYGSLELKHDSIGKGIMKKTGVEIAEEDAFYIGLVGNGIIPKWLLMVINPVVFFLAVLAVYGVIHCLQAGSKKKIPAAV